MVQIPNEFINNAGFVLFAVLSLYMLFVFGEALRRGGRGSLRIGYAVRIVRSDTRNVVIGLITLLTGVLGWTFGFANLGAAMSGLAGWVGPVWFWFVGLVMSGLNVLGITDYGIGQVVAAAAIFAVGASIIRVYRKAL